MAGKHDKVKDVDRFSIIYPDLTRCVVCRTTSGVNLHEIFHGTANRTKSKEDGLVAPLCKQCHQGQNGVHNNKELDRRFKIKAQRIWEDKYSKDNNCDKELSREAFIKRYGRNYDMEDNN